jgi:hypothetical protein
MPQVTCSQCGQTVHVTVLPSRDVKYTFELPRCTERTRPSTPGERFVDATKCPRLEASIAMARTRGEL